MRVTISLIRTLRMMFLRLLVVSLFVTIGAAGSPPNVVFISVDDLNDFPAFMDRYHGARTPHMDRLAERGTVFTRAHAQYPLCGPSRASVLSGLHPVVLGFDGHMEDLELQSRAEELGTELLHSYFARHGYETLAVGKIAHRHVPQGSVNHSGGRGDFLGGTGRLRRNWHQEKTSTDWAAAPEHDDELPDHHTAAWTVERLREPRERPFFMMVGFLRPHVPWYVPQKWFDLYDHSTIALPPFDPDDLEDVPAFGQQISIQPQMPRTEWAIAEDQWRSIIHAYLASTSFVDHQIGRVLRALEESPHHDNTIVVLWSDHGYHLGEKNTFQKHSLWERSSHVPLIVSVPGGTPGQRCDRVVSLIDLYPTLVELAGLPPNRSNQGRSLVPLLNQPDQPWPHVAITGWLDQSFAVQNERFRYIRYGDGSEELYDHATDLAELINRADDPDVKPLKVELAQMLREALAY